MPTINLKKAKPQRIKTIKMQEAANTYDYRWSKLRNAYLMEHPLCERCLKNGIIKAAKEVHHIRPILTAKDELEKKELTYDYNNLMALCIECHHWIHNQMRKHRDF